MGDRLLPKVLAVGTLCAGLQALGPGAAQVTDYNLERNVRRVVLSSCADDLPALLDAFPVAAPDRLPEETWSLAARRLTELWRQGGPEILDIPGRAPLAGLAEQISADKKAGACLGLPKTTDLETLPDAARKAGADSALAMAFAWSPETSDKGLGFALRVELTLLDRSAQCRLERSARGVTPDEYRIRSKTPDTDAVLTALTATAEEALDELEPLHHPCLRP